MTKSDHVPCSLGLNIPSQVAISRNDTKWRELTTTARLLISGLGVRFPRGAQNSGLTRANMRVTMLAVPFVRS
jgi:hypothetical protein